MLTLPSRFIAIGLSRRSLLACLLAIASSATGCSTAESDSHAHGNASGQTYAGKGPIRVTCTTGMVADLVRNIGGKHVAVEQLMGAGVDPHLYKSSPADVSKLDKADAIFYSGLHLEGKMAEVLERLAKRKLSVAVAEAIPTEQRLNAEGATADPHVWMDVSLWSLAAQRIADALVEYDPAHRDDYVANAKRYRDELAGLHTECERTLAQVAREQRVLVTAHDAFSYFGRAYHVEVRAIQGVSTDSEAGVREINELVQFITQRKIKAVFVESSVSENNVQSVIQGCRAAGHTVTIGGELYSDAMGPDGTDDATYVGMIRHNVATIVKALK